MFHLERITTKYIEAEDRIRLSGENGQGDTLVLWLTLRLLSKMLPHLVSSIEKQQAAITKSTNTLVHGFAQQAAQKELSSEPPVQTSAESKSWLVQEVDMTLTPEANLTIVFKQRGKTTEVNEQSQLSSNKATLKVETKQLRQWLGIIYAQWQRAGWPLALWPSWIEATDTQPSESISLLH